MSGYSWKWPVPLCCALVACFTISTLFDDGSGMISKMTTAMIKAIMPIGNNLFFIVISPFKNLLNVVYIF